jgi:hypothetical protein
MFLNLNKNLLLKNLNHAKSTNKFSKCSYSSLNNLLRNGFLEISDEVKYTNKPLVALESTIITHGLPYPTNLETALEVENEVRTNNAMPG